MNFPISAPARERKDLGSTARRHSGSPRRISLGWAVAMLLLTAVPAAAQAPAPEEFVGHWEGEITLPQINIPIMIDLAYANERWSGTIDIPQQGTRGIRLDRVWVETPVLHFAIPNVPGDPIFEGTLFEGKITGTLRQSGHEVAFHLTRSKSAPPDRPQEPKPPYPYRSEEVTYTNGEITLAGTLTIPSGDGPFPAVLLGTGSGPQNRNEELLGHKPFLVLADDLTRAGIAVLRVDDRGVGGSSGSINNATTGDFAKDALAGIRLLKGRKEIDSKRIGFIGHSEGALVGMLAAAESKDVRFLVLMAGPGVPGAELLKFQVRRMDGARGLPPFALDAEQSLLDVAIQRNLEGADSTASRSAIEAEATRLGESAPDSLTDAIAAVRTAILGLNRGLQTPWFRSFLTLDPRAALRRIRVPVLALNGELDYQVSADQNLPEIEKALAEAKNKDVTVRRMPGLNHLFQPASSGLPEEYMAIQTTLDPSVLQAIRNWILQRFGPKER